MHLSPATRLDDGLVERALTHDGIPGVLWIPPDAVEPTPLVLLGHPGDVGRMRPRLLERARRAADDGFAAAAVELPGAGGREPIAELEQARADFRRALQADGTAGDELVDRLVLPLVERAVPEARSTLDELLALPGIGGAVGYSGGFSSIGIRLAAVDPRIAALGLFAGSAVPRAIVEDARRLTIPVHVLLQWDDEGNDRDQALALFDALGSTEKTLQANLGGHTGVPAFAGEDAARFFARHLRPAVSGRAS